jgi:N-acyl-D-amino-acid deacylase
MVVDGSGRDPVVADVLIDGPVIRKVARRVDDTGVEPVEGRGLCLAPGFIDLHSHSDLCSTLRNGRGAPIGDAPKLLQGCTAQVFGQDGVSAAPFHDHDLADHADFLAGLDGTIPPDAWRWRSFGEYLQTLRAASATRSAGLVGHATVRRYVMGTQARPPSDDELAAMQAALVTAFDQGACGFSSGLVYVPAAYADTAEVAALCEVVAARHLPFFVHVRSESERVEEATDEVLEVAARTGVHLHYSHIKAAGRSNWHKAEAMLRQIDSARLSGVAVTADAHPYIAGSSTATVLLPPWVQEGGVGAALRRLSDPAVRAAIRRQLLSDRTSWDNWYAFSGGWTGLKIAGARRRSIVGRYFSEVIESAGIRDVESPAAFDLVFDLLSEERLGMSLVSFNNLEDNIARFLAQPYCSVGTDAVVNADGHPHPRLYGTFPRVLGHFVRERGTVPLPEAVRKMTSQAADIVGWGGRLGQIKDGFPADLVLFDPDRVADTATFERPRQAPVGIEGVWVGGRRLVEGGRLVGDTVAGEV